MTKRIIGQVRRNGGRPKGLQAARRHKVGILWLKGFSVRDIAELIQQDKDLVGAEKTTYVTVHKDIRTIKGDLIRHNIEDLDIRRSRSIEHLRLIQQRAWTELSRAVTLPNVRASLLSVISATEDRIAKLEGTYAPTEITGKGGKDLIPHEGTKFVFPDGSIYTPAELGGNGNKEASQIPES